LPVRPADVVARRLRLPWLMMKMRRKGSFPEKLRGNYVEKQSRT